MCVCIYYIYYLINLFLFIYKHVCVHIYVYIYIYIIYLRPRVLDFFFFHRWYYTRDPKWREMGWQVRIYFIWLHIYINIYI